MLGGCLLRALPFQQVLSELVQLVYGAACALHAGGLAPRSLHGRGLLPVYECAVEDTSLKLKCLQNTHAAVTRAPLNKA